MKKFSMVIFLSFLFLFTLAPKALAADLTITFNSDTCTLTPDAGSLFDELDVKPGDEIKRTLEVVNDSTEEIRLGIKMTNVQEPFSLHKLSPVLDLQVKNENTGAVIFEEMTMADWKNDTLVFPRLPAVEPGVVYGFYVSMDPKLGNDYQEKEFAFDLDFVCEGLSDTSGDIKGDTDTRKLPTVLPETGLGLAFLIPGILFTSYGLYLRRKSR